MPVNPKAVRVLNKVLDAGFTEEKAIAAMTMDDILSMQGITVADITLINDVRACRKSMMPRGRKGLTVRLSVCSMSMPSFVGRIGASPVTATQRMPPPPMPFIRSIWTK